MKKKKLPGGAASYGVWYAVYGSGSMSLNKGLSKNCSKVIPIP